MREFRGNTEIPVAGLVRDPGKQQPGEFLRRTSRQQQIVGIVERSCDLARNHGGAGERGMTAALDQTQEAVAFDELDLAQLDRGDRNQRRPAGNYCTQFPIPDGRQQFSK